MEQSESIPLSYLSQWGYCPRRAGLILLEQIWTENEYTAAGRSEHERAHTARVEKRGPLVKLYEYAVSSEKLGLSGKCDCIEATEDPKGCVLPFSTQKYSLYPIEYKHGTLRHESEYNLQLCAQAVCLEEMYGGSIPCGALFFIDAHRRKEVTFTPELRENVAAAAASLRKLLEERQVPHAVYTRKCKKCSLLEDCLPQVKSSADAYCAQLRRLAEDGEEE